MFLFLFYAHPCALFSAEKSSDLISIVMIVYHLLIYYELIIWECSSQMWENIFLMRYVINPN